jgi:hypothetical protein
MAPWRLGLLALLCVMPLGTPSVAQMTPEEAEPAESKTAAEPVGIAYSLEGVLLRFSGHVRPVVVWETQDYGDLGVESRDRFTAVGARTKLRLEGLLQDKARFYSAYILDFTEVEQGPYTASQQSEIGQIRMVESYVDLFGASTRWRAGSQQQQWGFFNGFQKPTDRFNPRDSAFKTRDTEDGRLPETGIEFVWTGSDQSLSLIYVPVSKVNKLSPNALRFLEFLGYEAQTAEVNSSNSKYVARIYGDVGGLSYQLSYIDGLNPRADLANDGFEIKTEDEEGEPIAAERQIESAINGRTVYRRYRSPAADLRYTVGAAKWKAGAVYYDTGDTAESEDPLRQNDWHEWLAGVEFTAFRNTLDLHYGQKVVPHLAVQEEFTPLDPQGKRVYFQNLLLDQVRDRIQIVTMKYRRNFLGDMLEFMQDFEWNWDSDWEQTRFLSRTEFGFYLDPGKRTIVRFRPGYLQNLEITTTELFAEVQFDF